MPRRELVRIVLVGDDGVGKSTIITSLIKESFVSNVQHVVPEVTIPPEVTPENVTTSIVDTSSDPRSRPHLLSQLTRAHVICLVYSISEPSSFDRVAEYWLPLFRREGINVRRHWIGGQSRSVLTTGNVKVPVILVGNKIDLRGGEVTNQGLEDEIAPLMREFKTLKPKCTEALRRIFRISDIDKDGLLNAVELNQFQQKCFSTPLQSQELEGILNLIRSYDPSLVLPLPSSYSTPSTPLPGQNQAFSFSPVSEGITEMGFLYLHTIFVQQGRMETTWTVLRKFGYGEGLDLREEFLLPRFDVPYDCSVELSPLGNQFLTDIFEAYDKDQDGALSQQELDHLFSTSPGNPWTGHGFPDTTITDEAGKVTLQGWLAQWSMTTLLDHRTTLNYLAYLGYSSSPATDLPTPTALQVTRPRKQDRRQRKVTRSVFLCYVLGATGSGKTSLLRSFVNKDRGREGELGGYEPTTKVVSVVNSVEMEGREKYLVLQEFGSKYESETLRNSKKLDLADIIIYVHDSSDTNSFSYISNLRQQYSLDHIPAIFVATKSDLDLAQQRHEVQPDVYCRRLGIPAPMAVSAKSGPMTNLWIAVTRVALNPASCARNSRDQKEHSIGSVDMPATLLPSTSTPLDPPRSPNNAAAMSRPEMQPSISPNLLTPALSAASDVSPALSILKSPALSVKDDDFVLDGGKKIEELKIPECWGHRGASAAFPENTKASFVEACRAGADGIETDIHMTTDDVLVMFHDPELGRTTDGNGRIDKLPWHGVLEHVRTLKAPHQPIPLFTEVLDLLMDPSHPNVKVNIDCKVENDPVRLFGLIKAAVEQYEGWQKLLAPRLILGIWHPKFIVPATEILPYLPRYAISMSLTETRKYFFDKCHGFSIMYEVLASSEGQKFRRECEAAGKEICCWTVNEKEEMRQCTRWGIKSVISDKPDLWRQVRKQIEEDRIAALRPTLQTFVSPFLSRKNWWFVYTKLAKEETEYLEREGGRFDSVVVPDVSMKVLTPDDLLSGRG
ncbi:phosphatidylglycerol phospholipase C, partial [Tremellales sp. Uapishka_1]